MEAASLRRVGLDHKAASCGDPEREVVPGLVLAHWWVKLGSGVGSATTVLGWPGVWDLVLACWWVGPVPGIASSGVWNVPRLVFTCW